MGFSIWIEDRPAALEGAVERARELLNLFDLWIEEKNRELPDYKHGPPWPTTEDGRKELSKLNREIHRTRYMHRLRLRNIEERMRNLGGWIKTEKY